MRPQATNILGLDQNDNSIMQNTVSTKHGRVELLAAGKDVSNLISSIENSSIEMVEERPMQSKLAKHSEHIMVD